VSKLSPKTFIFLILLIIFILYIVFKPKIIENRYFKIVYGKNDLSKLAKEKNCIFIKKYDLVACSKNNQTIYYFKDRTMYIKNFPEIPDNIEKVLIKYGKILFAYKEWASTIKIKYLNLNKTAILKKMALDIIDINKMKNCTVIIVSLKEKYGKLLEINECNKTLTLVT